MKKKQVVCGMAMGLMLAFTVSAGAATFTTDDGVISIYYSNDGMPYQNNGDGTFTDYYGNDYYLVN